jgi:hypothetical protein
MVDVADDALHEGTPEGAIQSVGDRNKTPHLGDQDTGEADVGLPPHL